MTVKGRGQIADLVFYMLVGTCYTFSLSYSIFCNTLLQITTSQLLMYCVMMLTLFYIVLYNKYSASLTLVLLILTGLGVWFKLHSDNYATQWFVDLTELIFRIIGFFRYEVPYDPSYDLPSGLIVTGILSLFTALTLHVRFNLFALLYLGTGIIATPVIMRFDQPRGVVILYSLCVLVLLVKKLNLLAADDYSGSDRSNSVFALSFVPVCALILAVSYLLPKPDTTTAMNMDIPEFAQQFVPPSGFSIIPASKVGFSDGDTVLGGPLEPNYTEILEVYADESVYLIGKMLDTYTGSMWTQSSSALKALNPDDDGSYYIGQRGYPQADAGEEPNRLTVRPLANLTSVFIPAISSRILISEQVTLKQSTSGSLTPFPALDRYTYYTVEYCGTAEISGGASIDESDVERYLELPDSLPKRVRDLALQITAGFSTDAAKADAIVQYLQQFPYTLNAERPPLRSDFTDYFLFTAQEGYCTYFATAMAVLSRCAGLPSRYVEGYVTPAQKNADGAYIVSENQAHAWAEVFIDGFGWVTSEATPPYYGSENSNSSLHIILQPRSIEGTDQILPTDAPQLSDNGDGTASHNSDDSNGIDGDNTSEIPTSTESSLSGNNHTASLTSALEFIPLIALISLLFLGGLYIVLRSIRISRIDRLSARSAVIAYFREILRLSKSCGFSVQPGETIKNFARRSGGELLPSTGDSGTSIEELASIFEKAAYSGDTVSDSERLQMKSGYTALRSAAVRHRLQMLKRFVPHKRITKQQAAD